VGQPEVDVVDAEPAERCVEVTQQRTPRRVDDPSVRSSGDAGLGADRHFVARHDVVEQRADDLLGSAEAVAVGRVEQCAARVDVGHQQVAADPLVERLPPHGGPQAESRHAEAGSPHPPAAHTGTLSAGVRRTVAPRAIAFGACSWG
jgi:hypothetical protein